MTVAAQHTMLGQAACGDSGCRTGMSSMRTAMRLLKTHGGICGREIALIKDVPTIILSGSAVPIWSCTL
jgi:hypothetical protein